MIQEANKVPTLQDIADQIGCARNTVSLALRGSKRISFKMRHQIELVSAQVGYVPNLAARNLKTQRSGLIGIYVESATDDVRVRLLNSLVNELHTTHYKPILGIANSPTEEKWHTAPWIQSFLALNVEALVVVKGLYEIDQPEADILKQLPTIIVGCEPDICCAIADCVALDRHAVGCSGVEHLLARGRTRICVAPRGGTFAEGGLVSLRHAGLEPCGPVVDSSLTPDMMEHFCEVVLAAQPRPDAVLLGDSSLAVLFMRAALQRGVRIPEDLALVGYDYFAWADDLSVPLTTIEQPVSEMVSLTITLVQDRLANLDAPKIQHVLPHRMVVRASS